EGGGRAVRLDGETARDAGSEAAGKASRQFRVIMGSRAESGSFDSDRAEDAVLMQNHQAPVGQGQAARAVEIVAQLQPGWAAGRDHIWHRRQVTVVERIDYDAVGTERVNPRSRKPAAL